MNLILTLASVSFLLAISLLQAHCLQEVTCKQKILRKLFKNPCSQAELNKIVPFGFSLQRQKNGVFFAIKIV